MKELALQLCAVVGGGATAWLIWRIMRLGPRPLLNEAEFAAMWERHRITDLLTYPAAFLGIAFTLWLYHDGGYPGTDWRPAGLGIGLIIALPLAVVAVRTLPHGHATHREFWQWYLHRYRIGATGVALIFGSCLVVGLIATFQLIQ